MPRKSKKKLLKKLQPAVQSFYGKALIDPEVHALIEELAKYPNIGPEYEIAMGKIYEYLDKLCKQEIKEFSK